MKKKRATPWKSGKEIDSICLRNGVYVLAQMVRDPIWYFQPLTRKIIGEGVTLKKEDILVCYSPVSTLQSCGLTPLLYYELPKEWL